MGCATGPQAIRLGNFWVRFRLEVSTTLTGRAALRDVMIQLMSEGVGSIPMVAVKAVLSGVGTSKQGGYELMS